MFSRRPSFRFNRGRGASSGAGRLIQFNKLVTSVSVLQAVQSDLGITLNGSAVSAWSDQSGNAKDYSQGTAANQPTYTAGALNGFPVIDFDGGSDLLTSTLNCPVPSYIWAIIRQDSWTAAEYLFSDAGNTARIRLTQNPGSPGLRLGGAVATRDVTPSVSIGAWLRVRIKYTNSTSDSIRAGATTATGTNTGNTASVGFNLGATLGPAGWADFSIAAFLVCNGTPSAAEEAALDAAAIAKYGSGVAT